MANPELGPELLGRVGDWQTVSLEIPDFLEPVREAIDAFFSFLIRILDILLAVLEILKVFATGLLDPLIAIIEALRDLIERILNDLRQLGIYFHGDIYALKGPDFQVLKGGYLAYEGRMVGRLQDTQDPNRPDISELSTCIAVFVFAQADIRGINRIVQLIKSILALFSRKYPVRRMMNQVSNVQATYGYDGSTIFSFSKSFFRSEIFDKEGPDDHINNPYNAVNLTWQMAPIPGGTFPDTPVVPPAGFLVEFSTLEQPIKIVCERVIEGSAQDMELLNQPPKSEVKDCIDEDGNKILIRGGTDQLDLQGRVNWNDALDVTGSLKSDAVRVYGLKNLSDRAPIALDQMQEGGKHYLQKTFFVKFAQNLFFPGKGFGATFLFDDMPFSAEWEMKTSFFAGGEIKRINDNRQPERFFVRVRAVTRAVQSKTGYQFLVSQNTLRDRTSGGDGPVLPLKDSNRVDLSDAGPPSTVTPILFPDASTQLYLRAVGEALAVMALSRADLPVLLGKGGEPVPRFPGILATNNIESYWSSYEGQARLATGIEDIAKFMMIRVIGRRQAKKFFTETDASVTKFRRKLFINCINYTNRLLTQNLPPLPARQLAIERAEDLLNYRVFFSESGGIRTTLDPDDDAFSDETGGSLLELLQSDDSVRGVAPNPNALDISDGRAADSIEVQIENLATLVRPPHFFFANQNNTGIGRGSVDNAPVYYNRRGVKIQEIAFARNSIPDSVYQGAAFVLQVAAGPAVRAKEGGWLAFRLFPQGIPAIDRFFDQILSLLRSIQAAIESIAETIRRYIEYLQSRIRELQAFLNRINALIQRLLRFFFSIQPAAGLVVVAPGTDGVTSALIASGNKPISPPNPEADSYGGGLVMFAGGLPNLALDVFMALFKGSDAPIGSIEGPDFGNLPEFPTLGGGS